MSPVKGPWWNKMKRADIVKPSLVSGEWHCWQHLQPI